MAKAQALRASNVESLLRLASRRRVCVLAIEQLALAVALIFAGLAVLLSLGTQILSPLWIIPLGCIGCALGAVRVRFRLLSRYRTAQILDSRLHLHDTLSTACFLLESSNLHDHPFAVDQIGHAEQVAQSVRPAAAFPITGHRGWAIATVLASVAFGLFAVRYLVTNSLSLQSSLIPIHLAPVLDRSDSTATTHSKLDQKEPKGNKQGPKQQSADAQSGRDTSDPPAVAQSKAGERGAPSPKNSPVKRTAADAKNSSNSRDPAQQGSASETQSAENREPQESNRASEAASSKGDDRSADGPQNSAGLVDKMRDALSSLMEKMRPNQASGKPGQSGEQNPNESRAADQAASSKNSGQNQSQTGQNQRTADDQNSEGQAQGQTAEKMQAAQGPSAAADKERGNDARSGIGRQDGDKSLREAEQLRAMGKLAEIIGKRSASLTGEMTVETPSGKQQLKTAYSQRIGRHQDSGGEINHDEIPLADQQYIRDYMEQVHREPKTKQ